MHVSKTYGSHARHSYCCPADNACVPIRHFSLVEANPPGAGLVTTGGLSKSHGERSRNLKFFNDSNTTKQDNDSWEFASPVYARYPLMLQLGGLLPQLTPGHQVPIYQLCRLEQCEYSFSLNETTTNTKVAQ